MKAHRFCTDFPSLTAQTAFLVSRNCKPSSLPNFKLIKRMILDTEDLHSLAGTPQGKLGGGMYRKVESLTTTAHRILDLS
jgi:hypothetical protein